MRPVPVFGENAVGLDDNLGRKGAAEFAVHQDVPNDFPGYDVSDAGSRPIDQKELVVGVLGDESSQQIIAFDEVCLDDEPVVVAIVKFSVTGVSSIVSFSAVTVAFVAPTAACTLEEVWKPRECAMHKI